MRPFQGRRVLLGITGGIASYKAAWLARLLQQAGAEVDVVMTRSATEFVGAVTLEALTGRPVHTALIAPGHALDHIRLARAADAVVVAPCTADFLARAAGGHADDLLSACLLATPAPVLLVPAMNDRMWAHPQVRANADHARAIGYHVLSPDDGPLAVGEGSGPGRMPEPETILAHVGRLLDRDASLAGRRVVVTAGPTREALDPVRYLTNHSSGRMGVELAAAAWRRGADVTLVHGPLQVPVPAGVRAVAIESTAELRDAVAAALPDADALVMAAAPADFRPAQVATQKIKRGDGALSIALTANDDILAGTRDLRRPGAVVVGFALETTDLEANARKKLASKGLDLIVLNDATEPGAGFGVETNRVTFLTPDGAVAPLALLPKRDVADAILDRVGTLLAARRAR
ncbi:bifunctional phosphopantothenoylcysteine decarboxylase/phosphopantothenate--cysteine ligase CoaBC [Roseisolibacter sp. H3M3-2]|uniref:bifunctional phosphopantothenoylcysteine decarboxylase/phosphopantothenate--cysteine ligase CoaBC n=1 Tax=Roseisolibacter sp. H3M3-2 TaxID=3031323 RepID=UPI0023DA6934|nr:bifunctional phosphopantothenoylcysteine decarboxylase/phosphopantothenate--cysteine ligase CoaBC [Roseisolibacter sp. H3M3-2]MDF1501498.1 bifunctional phosphopantothenoylcysteine decarboxylase/phosphopantothenate--cysteine ligase CoaBC [Roseisolibacter sp. H3M3-2]